MRPEPLIRTALLPPTSSNAPNLSNLVHLVAVTVSKAECEQSEATKTRRWNATMLRTYSVPPPAVWTASPAMVTEGRLLVKQDDWISNADSRRTSAEQLHGYSQSATPIFLAGCRCETASCNGRKPPAWLGSSKARQAPEVKFRMPEFRPDRFGPFYGRLGRSNSP